MTNIDKYDGIISISSGALTAAMDVLWGDDLSLMEAHKWGAEETNKFVLKVAKKNGYKGSDLAGAIDHLEEAAPIWADKNTNEFGGGYHHHLRDFSHHPTPVGLFFSLLNEFTGYGYGTDTDGKFKKNKIEGWKEKGFLESIYSGTINWSLHLISDVAGSSGSVRMGKEGTGLPGPFMSLLKELASVPGIRDIAGTDKNGRYQFSVACQKLFNGTLLSEHDENGKIIKDTVVPFDMRTELGLLHEPVRTKQYIPVLICEGIVCAFYSIRRLINEIIEEKIDSLEKIRNLDFSKFLPWKSNELKRMRTLSALSFSAVDMSAAAVSAYVQCDGDKKSFIMDFAKQVNYFGVGRLIIAGTGEVGMRLEKIYDEYLPVVEKLEEQVSINTDKLNVLNKDMKYDAAKPLAAFEAIAGIGTPIGFIGAAIGVYKEISSSVEEYNLAHEERLRIEEECITAIDMLREYREEMEVVVSEYMIDRLSVFGAGMDMMDEALLADDTDKFIQGNNMIQQKLGTQSQFSSQDEFDDLMLSDGDFKL